MSSFVAATFEFIFALFSYITLFMYGLTVGILGNVGVHLASIPVGEWLLDKLDSGLQVLDQAVSWTSKDSKRTASWMVFLPLVIIMKWTRLILNASVFVLLGEHISDENISRSITFVRDLIQQLKEEGTVIRENSMPADPNDFLIYRVTKLCIFKPIARISRSSLYFLGCIPNKKVVEGSDDTNDNGSSEKSEERPSQESNHEGEHHDHHQ